MFSAHLEDALMHFKNDAIKCLGQSYCLGLSDIITNKEWNIITQRLNIITQIITQRSYQHYLPHQ